MISGLVIVITALVALSLSLCSATNLKKLALNSNDCDQRDFNEQKRPYQFIIDRGEEIMENY